MSGSVEHYFHCRHIWHIRKSKQLTSVIAVNLWEALSFINWDYEKLKVFIKSKRSVRECIFEKWCNCIPASHSAVASVISELLQKRNNAVSTSYISEGFIGTTALPVHILRLFILFSTICIVVAFHVLTISVTFELRINDTYIHTYLTFRIFMFTI